jgi:hypothetical protein
LELIFLNPQNVHFSSPEMGQDKLQGVVVALVVMLVG